MIRHGPYDHTDEQDWSLDSAVEWILGALLVFAPFAYGSIQAWSQEVVLALIAIAGICVVAKRPLGQSRPLPWSYSYLIILAFIGLCAFQLVPLPAGLLRLIAPGTLRLKTDLLSDLPNAAALTSHLTISFYSRATFQHLLLVTAVAAMFFIVIDVYRDAARVSRLLMTIVGVGLAVGLLAVYQKITHATTIYGLAQAGHPNSGPFLVYSHFSQFMNLSVGAAFGLLLVKLSTLSSLNRTSTEWLDAARDPSNAVIWVLLLTCIIGPVTIFFSMSRMGMISLISAGTVTGLLIAFRGRTSRSSKLQGQFSLLMTIAFVVLGALLYFGSDTISARLATVNNYELTFSTRVNIVKDILAEFKNYPVLGSGLGTNEFVYPMFDHLNIAAMAVYADNEYAQLLEETGILGVALAVAFIIVITGNFFRATSRLDEPIQFAAFGIAFGLIAILIHSTSDFGQHIPAIALLTAASSALLINLARNNTAASPLPQSESQAAISAWTLGAGLASLICITSLCTGAFLWADRARRAESLWAQRWSTATDLEDNNWAGSADDYQEIIAPATAAAALEPDNINYLYELNAYRWHSLGNQATQMPGQFPPVHLPFARQIVAELDSVRPLCPTFGPPLSIAGQLKTYALGDAASGKVEIEKAFRLTPYDTTVCLVLGTLDVHEQRWNESVEAFTRYYKLGGAPLDFIDLYVSVARPDLAYYIVLHDRRALELLASRMPKIPSWASWVAQCQRDCTRLLIKEAQQPDASPQSVAELAGTLLQQGKDAEAIDLYQRALASDYGEVNWRLQLSRAMADLGRYAEAIAEVKICLGLRPELAEAHALMAQYNASSKSAKAAP